MGFGNVIQSNKGGFGNVLGTSNSSSATLNTPTGLIDQAMKSGLGKEAKKITQPSKKLSALQRLSAGLGAFNPAEALLTGIEKKSAVSGLGKYAKGVGVDIAEAVRGRDIDTTERRTFSDVVKKAGVTGNDLGSKILRGGLGFAGDVLLDPTTYFGGAIAKGLGKGLKSGTELALKGTGKVAPKVEAGLRLAGQGVKEAGGKAFKYGFGTSKGLPEKALEIQSKLAKTKEGIVASNLARLGTGTLSKGQQEELVQKLLAGKRTELELGRGTTGKAGAKEVAQSSDPLVQKTIGEQATRSQKFAKQARIKDPYEIYFPGLKNDSVKNFLEGTKPLKVGSQGYLKQFKNLIKDEDLIKNPAEAFAKREWDIAKDNIVRGELNQAIKAYGKPLTAFKTSDDALKAGYKVIKEKGQFGKEIGYLKEVDKKFLDDLISPEFTSIDMIAKATGFDALTSLFKRSVTGLFPAFHVRNFVSGHIQNFEALGIGALNPKMISNGQKMAWKLAQGDKSLFKGQFGKQMKAFADRFGTDSSYIADIADATKGSGFAPGKFLSKESFKETAKTLGVGQQSQIFRGARAIGNYIETQQKATAYLTALAQGKPIKEALELATKAGFDYRALTGFESKILRRIIPFYSFTRKNIELQLKTLGENPQRINQILKTFDNLQEGVGGDISKEEKEALPDYAKEGFTIKTGTSETGEPEIATGFGTPLEAFTGLFGFGDKGTIEKQLSTLNNIIKAPLERAVGKDFFRDRDLNKVVEANEYSKMPQFVKDFLELREVKSKDFKTGKEKIKYTANPNRLHMLRQLPTTRGVSTLYNVYNGDVTPKSRLLYATTGIKPRPIDLETEKYFRDKKQQDALEDLLLRSGVIKKFENVYIPKEKKKGGFGG